MNRDTTLGFILIAVILIGYSIWMTPSKEDMAERQYKQDSVMMVRQQQRVLDSTRMIEELRQQLVKEQTSSVDSVAVSSDSDFASLQDRYGFFAISAHGTNESYIAENEQLKLTFSSKGGFLKQVELKEYHTWDTLPLIMYDSSTAKLDLSFFAKNRTINTADLYFRPFVNGKPLSGNVIPTVTHDSLILSLRAYAGDNDSVANKYIAFEYIIYPTDYKLGFNLVLEGMDKVLAGNTTFMNLDWSLDLLNQERSIDRFNSPTIFYKHLSDDVENLSLSKNEEKSISTKLRWVSFKQQFFSTTLVANDYFENADLKTFSKEQPSNSRYMKSVSVSMGLPVSLSFAQPRTFD